jgi:hypothetical protein
MGNFVSMTSWALPPFPDARKQPLSVAVIARTGRICHDGCQKEPCEVEITTDAEYVRLGITQWVIRWKRRPRG